MPTFETFDSVVALGPVPPHHDARVWPDDIDWFGLHERHVLAPARIIRIHRVVDGRASVTLPVVVERSGPARVVRALGNYYTPDFRPLCSEPVEAALIAALLRRLVAAERPDAVILSPLEPRSMEAKALEDGFRAIGWPTRTGEAFANWVHDVERPGTPEAFDRYIATRPSRVRNTLAKKRARLLARAGVTVAVHDGRHDLGRLVEQYRTVYARSWKVPEPHVGFVPALIAKSAREGRLRLGLVMADGEPIAVHLWIVKGGCASIFKLAHDAAWNRHSPGTVLMGEMLRHVLERDGVARVDFLSGDDPYKRDWMSERRCKVELRSWNPRTFAGLARFAREAWAAPLAARVRGVPR